MHIPVLEKEVLELLAPKPGEDFCDATFGWGGHSRKILEKTASNGKLLAIDWDAVQLERAMNDFPFGERVGVKAGNYSQIRTIAAESGFENFDGIIADLGISSWHLEHSGRGFSFQKDEPLDMRYSPDSVSAAEVVNGKSEQDLKQIFFKYGEERFSGQIAKMIFQERQKERILTASQLVEVIRKAVPAAFRRQRIHFATRVFQALRIYCNRELENLRNFLPEAMDILKPGGRLAIISFHSLEDRIVKNFFRESKKNNICEILTKKPTVPSEEETKINPRARSAKLRVIKKNG